MYKVIRALLFGLFIATGAVYWLQLGGEQTILLRNTLYLLFPLFSVVAGVFALNQYGFQGKRTPLLLSLTFSMAGLFTGEILFFIYEFVLHIDPFPSAADFFYLLAYPLLLHALIRELRQTPITWESIRPSIRFLLTVVSVAIATLVFYFGVYLAYDPQGTWFSNAIALSYGIGDLGLIVADVSILVLAWEFRHGSFSSLWIRLFLSFISMLVADILFAMFTDQYLGEVWLYKSFIDTFFMLSYVLFADGLLHFGFTIANARLRLKKVETR